MLGLPTIDNGNLIYSETPEKIKEIIPRIIEAGANIIGGCCGTTPEHIKVISEIVRNYNQKYDSIRNYRLELISFTVSIIAI